MFRNKINYKINIEIQPVFIKNNKGATRSDVLTLHSAIAPKACFRVLWAEGLKPAEIHRRMLAL